MPTLDPSLRDLLATVIGKEDQGDGARAVAEAGARAALKGLAVDLATPHAHLGAAEKQLRNQLRARARQLGDLRKADGQHEIRRLVEQVAYEHWHRMLFARFLAENFLLIHPSFGTAVTLDECAELASSEGAEDAWELAGRYASRMLPQIFRPDDPVLAVKLAAEHQHELERLLAGLPAELFRASDSLGWCYQFWQSRRKKEVNASEVKIGADELPAVTQLFTEPYMVQFLLHNTLGAWWVGAGRALPVEMPYLRRLDDGTPAAGTFKGWPRVARELKVLDPCCGSGHFLVAAFEILVAFRMAEGGLTACEACDAVLRDNLFGLEIDARCVQIAAFALAMAAWTWPNAGGYRPLPAMNVACSGLAISAKRGDWEKLGADDLRIRNGLTRMWDLFRDSPVLGSLVDPRHDPPDPLHVARFEELQTELTTALAKDAVDENPDTTEVRVIARGLAHAGIVLARLFTLVVTNVPYLSRVRQGIALQALGDSFYPAAKYDLATMFLQRSLRLSDAGSSVAAVTPQNWLYQDYYRNLRIELMKRRLDLVCPLGEGAFETISGEVVKPALLVLSNDVRKEIISGVDCTAIRSATAKATALREGEISTVQVADIARTQDRRIVFGGDYSLPPLKDFVDYHLGLCSGDFPRFGRNFWEILDRGDDWSFEQTTVTQTGEVGGLHFVFLFQQGTGRFYQFVCDRLGVGGTAAWIRGGGAWGKAGVAISPTGEIRAARYFGALFDNNTIVLTPKNPDHLAALWAYCESPEYGVNVRIVDKALKVTSGLVEVPFDLPRWSDLSRKKYPRGLGAPTTNDPTQWVFPGKASSAGNPLHVAVARLLGYRWPDQKPDALDAHADGDGIVCIPALRGERPAADRLADLLIAAWGKDWHPQTLTDLLAAVGHHGTLEEWLRDAFFRQHCELFHHRPFVWHIWDGHRDGFSALVNYHKLDHEGLKSLTYTYLGDWIRTQEIEAKAGKSGAGDKLAKAKGLQRCLAAILEGEAPLDVFVRWKPIEEQPIGWHPDLDDGVRLNIRPFLTVADVGAKGAGVLRWKPNIKWGKDRGKNPPGSPWGEDRDNDRHLTLAEKVAARGAS